MSGNHDIACSLTSTLLKRVKRTGGGAAVDAVLEAAGSAHTAAYLYDVSNWISYDEAIALFAAAVEVTGDAGVPRLAGEDTVRQHAGTSVATVLRSMGSPEAILQQVTTAVTKFSLVTEMEAVEVGPGHALVHARARPGYRRDGYLCDWTKGLLSQPTVLFGLLPATVEETACQARGASECVYEVHWDAAGAAGAAEPEQHITALEAQLAAMAERVESVLATAGDLISHDDLDAALARITDRAATTVRAPKYLLAVRPTESSELHCHHRGLTDAEAAFVSERLSDDSEPHPEGWLVADVSSGLRHYGRLVAINDQSRGFFPQERQLFVVYARFAATVLDRATALAEAQHRRDEAQAMLELSRALAAASGTAEVAETIVAAVPSVVDCERVALFLWDADAGELSAAEGSDERLLSLRVRASDTPALAAVLTSEDPQPLYFDSTVEDPFLRDVLDTFGDVATLAIPVAARGEFFGVLTIAVVEGPERLRPTPDLLDRLSGVVAQAATALQGGRLIDRVTHQALHDGLTGLANRELFGRRLEQAVATAGSEDASVALFYADVDSFKAVNDAYGHAAGDVLLRQVADRLARSVRASDTVARLGGDEFAVLLAGAPTPAEIDAVARRVAAAFDRPFVVEGHSMRVSASVGRAVWPADGKELERLLRTADTDMYRVKRDRAARMLAP